MLRRNLGGWVLLSFLACAGTEPEPSPSPEPAKPREDSVQKGARSEAVDLGVALYPEGYPRDLVIPRFWKVPPTHQLSYGLGLMEEREIRDAYDLYKDALQVEFRGDGYWHVAPPECRQDLRCAYDLLFRVNAPAVSPIAERFLEHARSHQLPPRRLARAVVTYVQAIEYSRVMDDPYGLVPPAVVVNSFGDCDSKALLAVMLLRMVGIDAVIVSSDLARHAMVGLGLHEGRDRLQHLGRTYAFVEITAPRWPVGHLPPRYRSYRDWRVVPFATPAWTQH